MDQEARRYVLYARQGEPRCVMPPPMDLSLHIPVICTQEDAPKYNGKCLMEAISKVKKLNGQSVSSDSRLTKADFTTGDVVAL